MATLCEMEYFSLEIKGVIEGPSHAFGATMSGEFDSMFDDVRKDRAAEAEKARQAAEARMSDAVYGFNLRAQPLRDIVLPVLQEAVKSFENQGLVLSIDARLEPGNDASYRSPAIRFSFSAGASNFSGVKLERNVQYYFSVSHLQGGIRCGKEYNSPQAGVSTNDLSNKFDVKNVEDLTRDKIVEFVRFALNDITK